MQAVSGFAFGIRQIRGWSHYPIKPRLEIEQAQQVFLRFGREADAELRHAVTLRPLRAGYFRCRACPSRDSESRRRIRQPLLRELIIPFCGAGHVALFEVEDPQTVTIPALRQQREEHYH